jgi:DNA-binding SARP family transcriptional activator
MVNSAVMIRLRVLGPIALEGSGSRVGPAAEQRKPLALLTLVAMARESGLTREKLVAYLWPDASEENSRNTLKQTLYSLRRDLGCEDLFISGPAQTLIVNPAHVAVDAWEFDAAIARGALEEAAALHRGPFLDGFFLRGCAEFEQWAERSRARLDEKLAQVLRELAERAHANDDIASELGWWRRLAEKAPLDSTVALRLMEALAASGNRAAALQHAGIHTALLREELGATIDPAIVSFADRLRSTPADHSISVAAQPEVAPRQRPAPIEPATTNATQSARRSRWKRTTLLAMSAVVVVSGAAFLLPTGTRTQISNDTVAIGGDLVAIAPFHLVAPDTSLSYLSEGVIDLLGAQIGGIGPVHVASPATFAIPWLSLRAQRGVDPSMDDAIAIARRSRATKLIIGSLVVSGERVALDASLMDVASGASVATARAEGGVGELPLVVDRLAAELLSLFHGGNAARMPAFGATPLAAVRAYATGRSAFRAGDYQSALTAFRQAIDVDSTFALAALAMCRAAAWSGDATARYRGYRVAWASRHRLSPADRALLVAIVGPRFPEPSSVRERVLAWEEVTRLDPDQPDAWFELGDLLFHAADLIGDSAAHARIPLALGAALTRDSSYGPALEHIVQYAARANDTALARAYAARAIARASAGEADFLRWRVGLSLPQFAGDTKRVRQHFESLDLRSLRSIALAAMSDQVAAHDAEQALAFVAQRAPQSGEQVDALIGLHAASLVRGKLAATASTLDRLAAVGGGESAALYLRVLDAILAGGDSDIARTSAEQLEQTKELVVSRNAIANDCVAGQWRLATADIPRARRAMDGIRRSQQRPADENVMRGVHADAATCLALLEAWERVLVGGRDAARFVGHADSLIAQGPDMSTRLESEIPLVMAMLWERVGRPAEALRAIRRVGYFYRWPHYRAEELRTEGRLAAATGDTTGAIDAYRRYLDLRDAPDADLASDVRIVRQQLESLSRGVH